MVVKAIAAEGEWTIKLKACALSPVAMNIYNQFAEYVLLVPGEW